MNKRPLLLPRIVAAVLAVCTFACTISLPVCTSITAAAASILPQASSELRAHLRAHEESFSISVSGNEAQSEDFLDKLIDAALAETGRSTDGDYIRYSILKVDCDRVSSYGQTKAFNFRIVYTSTAAQEDTLNRAITTLEEKLNFTGKSDYEKVSAVYNYITTNVKYDSSDGNAAFSAYSALFNGRAVCQGVAQLTYRLLMDAGVSCRIIPGYGNGGDHAWNIAAVNGKYYYIDATWDIGNTPDCYSYFLRGATDLDSLDRLNYHSLEKWNSLDKALYQDYLRGDFFQRYPVSATCFRATASSETSIGDVNGDGLIDSNDATAVIEEYASLSTSRKSLFNERQTAAGDANGDGAVDSSDASLILAYYSYVSTGGSMTLAQFRTTT